jgi:hypothetical protein
MKMNKLLVGFIVVLIAGIIIFFSLNIICCGPPNVDPGPQMGRLAGEMVASQVNFPGGIKTSHTTIVKLSETVSAEAVSKVSNSITPNQVCISVGDFEDDPSFVLNESQTAIQYLGDTGQRIRVSVICDTGFMLQQDLDSYGVEGNWLSTTPCQNVAKLNQMACIVALRQD